MTKQQTNELFTKYEKMLHDLSHKCATRCGRPEDEVFGQASFLFMKAVGESNKGPDLGPDASFSSFLWTCVHNGLLDWAKKNDLPPDPDLIPERVDTTPRPDKAMMVKEWLEGLSEECKEVAAIILNGPGEVLDLSTTPTAKEIKGALRRYLREEKRWSWPRIWETFTTLKKEIAAL